MEYWDAHLTPLGKEQCATLKASIRGDGVWGYHKPLNLDLVVVSPLTRCLQTAVLSLGDPCEAQARLTTARPDPNPNPIPWP
jgi:broad specificity phosphatase PhoE